MQKVLYISLFLMLSIISCKKKDNPDPIVQESTASKMSHPWTCVTINYGDCGSFNISLNSDGTGTMEGIAMTWTLSSSETSFSVNQEATQYQEARQSDFDIIKLTDTEFIFLQPDPYNNNITCTR